MTASPHVPRRLLLGAAGALGAGSVLALPSQSTAAAPSAPLVSPRGSGGSGTAAARAALERLLPDHADQFRLVRTEDTGRAGETGKAGDAEGTGATGDAAGRESFRVTGRTGAITVEASGQSTLLTGVHWYLKYACDAHIAWNGDQLDLPKRLPAPRRPLERSTTLTHRFALNDTSDGYTAPYAGWAYWERMIDVLALHGCNEVMVIAGAEAVYHRVLTEFGYSDAEARAWLPAPSHQPWWLLQNLSGYGGPLTPELIDRRAELGRRIADRLRELDMAPVLPGYYGHVPDGFVARNGGDARVVPQGKWHGFKRPDWLDPRTEAFAEVAASFYRHQGRLFGTASHFKMDLLHEGGNPGDVPVADAARGVERALRTAHPDGTWVILGWQDNPLPELLDAVDKRRMLIVDGVSDRYTSVTDREKDWAGTPYCFGTIPNFGGRTTIGARAHLWEERFFAWRDKPGSALAGTAYLPEAADRDPAAFELFSELAWSPTATDRPDWFASYADFRYGGRDGDARKAWQALEETAYRHTAHERSDPHDSLFCARPSLSANKAAYYAPSALTYDPARFDAALTGLLRVAPARRGSAAYSYDLVDVGRQALAHRGHQYLPQLEAAYGRGDKRTFRALAAQWLELMRLSDELTGAHPAFLLGPWIEDARRTGTTDAERAEFERTAKVLLTVWGGRTTSDAGNLHEYANREWHGLIREFYLPRWKKWLDALEDAMDTGEQPPAVDWFAFEEPWTRTRKNYPLRPVTDAHRTATRVHEVLASAPYQGALEVTAEPSAFPPGGHALLRAAFRNVNGLRATGPVDFTLTGVDAEPEGPTRLPRVPPAGTGSVRWRATAPGTPLDEPLRPLPYTLTVRYGPQGERRVDGVHSGTVFEAGPLADGWRTVSGNEAVFGQLGERFAIDGAGADLWKGTAQFGAAYRAGALSEGGTVTLTVDSQASTAPWARAGIVVRNSLAAPARAGSGRAALSAGFLNLAVTPANGIVLSWDSNGDGTLDTYRRITGIAAPVTLRLSRAVGGFTGECSVDGGANWRTVATVQVPGAAAQQDAGLFMTAANGGSGARGTVSFSGWSVTR